jgi:predicted nucleotidyltransferase
MSPEFAAEIRDITVQLIEKYAPERITLFGCAARGDATADSDADFLIIKRHCPHLGADRIREVQRLIDRNIPADLLAYRPEEFEQRLAMGDPFLTAIVREGKVLHG